MRSLSRFFRCTVLFLSAAAGAMLSVGWLSSPAEAEGLLKFPILVDGRPRLVYIHVPEALKTPTAAVPAVIVLHGGGGNGPGAERMTGMSDLADKKGFLAVYPEGSRAGLFGGHAWNAGRCCGSPMKHEVNDVKFLDQLIDELKFRYKADPARIYLTGISNGAQMAYRAACDLSEKIAAIAPVAGQRVAIKCQPLRPVSIIAFHGTDDPCTPYAGGKCGGCLASFLRMGMFSERWDCPAVNDDIVKIATDSQCSERREQGLQKGAVSCLNYPECSRGTEITLCSIRGGGHTWPGGKDGPTFCDKNPQGRLCRRFRREVGPLLTDVSATELMWDFFEKHPRP